MAILDHESVEGVINSSTLGFVSFETSKKLPSIVTGDGGGDNCGEVAASMTFVSSPIRLAASATIADNSASSSSDDDDEDEDDEDDEVDEDEDEDRDDVVEFEEDRMRLGNSKSLTAILLSLLGFLASV